MYQAFNSFVILFGFIKSNKISSLFIHRHDGIISYFLVGVNNWILTRSNTNLLQKFVISFACKISLKELGNLHYFLGVEVKHTKYGLFLTQHKYIKDILDRATKATIFCSSTEAEYHAVAVTTSELTCIQSLLHELGVSSSTTPCIYCDNIGDTRVCTNPVSLQDETHCH